MKRRLPTVLALLLSTAGALAQTPPAVPPPAAPAPAAAAAAAPAPPAAATAAPADTGPVSPLMYGDDDVASIRSAVADFKSGHTTAPSIAETVADLALPSALKPKPPPVPNIYVSAVLNLGGDSWTVWANGRRITTDSQPALFHVTAVVGDVVQFEVPNLTGSIKFSLRPFQTWVADKRSIVEGIVP